MTLGWSRWVVLLAAVASVVLTASLGMWQWRRAAVKQAALEALQAQATQPPWRNGDWPCAAPGATVPASLPVQRPVLLTGQWVAERTVLLENRAMDGMSGFDVVTPLRLANTPGSLCGGRIVLVQRGWVPRDPRDRLRLPALPMPQGDVRVPGRLVAGVSQVYQIGQEAPPSGPGPVVRQNVDAAFWRAWLGQSPVVGAVLQLQAEQVQPDAGVLPRQAQSVSDPLRRHWPQPDQGQGKHLAYAAQWFAMAALITGLYVWYQLIRPRRASGHAAA